jgi:hypothetical protein
MTRTLCTRCGINEAPAPDSIEDDPICIPCALDGPPRTCPGYGPEECGNAPQGDSDLCPDCLMARLDAESPRTPNRAAYDFGTGGWEYYH